MVAEATTDTQLVRDEVTELAVADLDVRWSKTTGSCTGCSATV